jgi:DNA-binding CsgD family transcriptional regulator
LYRRFFGIQKPQQAWSAEDKNNLVRLKKEGHTSHEIATVMGRTLASVQTQIFLLVPPQGRRFRTWTQEEQQKLIELTKANRSVEEIMKSMGRTREAVIFMQRKIAGMRVKKLTLKTSQEYTDWTEEEHQKLKELALAGHSNDELARIMGRTRASVQMRCRRVLGLKYSRKQAYYYQPGSGLGLD